MSSSPAEIADNIYYLGTFGKPPIVSTYLVKGKTLALIESGPPCVSEDVVKAIETLGFNITRVHHIIVTHIHIDHSGGSAKLLGKMPNAEVLAYQPGVKHLIDPSRLIPSARIALGEVLEYWGEPQPLPPQKVRAVNDGDTLDLGGVTLRFIAAPGHAPHEMAIYEENTGSIFTGDTVGVYRASSQTLVPDSPPPSFDYPKAMDSLNRLADLNPDCLMIPHYGYYPNAQEMLQLNLKVYKQWAELLKPIATGNGGVDQALTQIIKQYPEYAKLTTDPYTVKLLKMDISGFLAYFQKTHA
ncbi:MAG: MBL fold metallo-hydrolase [Thaumarchaeota archaeon]|nr:MBL fold metallo-hydrolase [Nitrososphaerota archaeon]